MEEKLISLSIKKLASLMLGLLFCSSGWSMPSEFQAIFNAQLKQIDGQVMMTLKKEQDNLYSYEMITRPSGFWRIIIDGSIREKSTFSIENGVIRSKTYELNDTIRSKPRQSSATFDWDNLLLSGYYKDRKFELPLNRNVIDRVVLQIAIIHNNQQGINSTEHYILDRDKVKRVQINQKMPVNIRVPFGQFEAIEIEHVSEGSDSINSLWLAPELGYIPVKLTQKKDGKTIFSASLSQLTH
jgi:hypothetical protein